MNTRLLPSLLATVFAVATPMAGAENFSDYGRVISATPEYQQTNSPREECYRDSSGSSRSSERSLMGPIIGGITGAVIGSSVGKGRGNRAATAVGAVTGAIVGDRLGNSDSGYGDGQRCRTVDHWEQRLTGYRVVYEYQGQTFNTVTPYDPGRRIRLNVSVAPANDGNRYGDRVSQYQERRHTDERHDDRWRY